MHSQDSSNVFTLDLGLALNLWLGKSCTKDKKFKAIQYLQKLKMGEQVGTKGGRTGSAMSFVLLISLIVEEISEQSHLVCLGVQYIVAVLPVSLAICTQQPFYRGRRS